MAHPVTPRATFTWGPSVRHIYASEHLSHFQTFGRGARSYYNGRHDTAFWDRAKRKRQLVVAGTRRASLKGHQ